MEKNLEIIHKEIDLIQNCIKRLDDRSLLIRGWSVALVGIICSLKSDSIFIFDPEATPVSLGLLLMVNAMFFLIDKHNNKKKWYYVKLYNWTIHNRGNDDIPWTHVYDLNYKRFEKNDKDYRYSKFGSMLFNVIWAFVFILMAYHTINKISPPKNKPVSHSTDSAIHKSK